MQGTAACISGATSEGGVALNWTAIGAIGELLGAVAVVGTLAYVAIQVRQQTKSIQSASFQATTDALNYINMSIATDPQLLRVISARPQSLTELSAEDRYRYSYILLALFRVRETAYHQLNQGTTALQSWTREAITTRQNLESPAARDWWRTIDYGFTPEFTSFVNRAIAEIEFGKRA